MPTTQEPFKNELRLALRRHTTLEHPIFGHLLSGPPNWELLRTLALQGYQLTKHFAGYIEHLFLHCPIPAHKRTLLRNLYEEETGGLSGTKNHLELLHDFIRALGISDAERDGARPLPDTLELIEYRLRCVQDPWTYHMGAAAVLIASEGQNLETRAGQARDTVLTQRYGIASEHTLFFSLHQHLDMDHVEEGISLVADLCLTDRQREEALHAVDHTCRLFYRMYDGIARHLAIP